MQKFKKFTAVICIMTLLLLLASCIKNNSGEFYLSKLERYDATGANTGEIIYFYNQDKQLAEIKEVLNGKISNTTTFQYDGGDIKYIIKDYAGTYSITEEYDEDGKIVKSTQKIQNIVSVSTYDYIDENGSYRLTQSNSINNSVMSEYYYMDKNGNQSKYISADGKEYITENEYNKDRLVSVKTNTSITKYKYDDSGRIIEEESYIFNQVTGTYDFAFIYKYIYSQAPQMI